MAKAMMDLPNISVDNSDSEEESGILSPHCRRTNNEQLKGKQPREPSQYHLSISQNCLDLPTTAEVISAMEEIPGTDSELLENLRRPSFCAHTHSIRTSPSKTFILPSSSSFENIGPTDDQILNSIIPPSVNYIQSPTIETNQIIIVEPDSSDPTESAKFFTNDLKFAKDLDSSPFCKINKLSVTKNFSKKFFVFRFPKVDQQKLNSLLNIKHIGNTKIKCRLPISHTFTRGVIGPIGLDTSVEELSEYLKDANPSVTNVKRLNKGNSKIPTLSLMIQFQCTELPDYVTIGYQKYKVRQFIPSPWQCFNCQRFGHSAKECRSKPRCLMCAGTHESKQCPMKTNNETIPKNDLKCANCLGNHAANYGGCHNIKKAKTVETVRTEKKLSYRDALAQVHSSSVSNYRNNAIDLVPINYSISNPQTFPQQAKLSKNACTQTDALGGHDTVKNLSVLLIKMFKLFNLTDNGNKTNELINLVQNTVGVDISREIIEDSDPSDLRRRSINDSSQQIPLSLQNSIPTPLSPHSVDLISAKPKVGNSKRERHHPSPDKRKSKARKNQTPKSPK